MIELKTRKSDLNANAFVDSIDAADGRRDCRKLMSLMKKATGAPPQMWGSNIVGFGSYQYRYQSGQLNVWFVVGFSSRKQNLATYIMPGFAGYSGLLNALGKHNTGKSCLYLTSLADIDIGVLRELISRAVSDMRSISAKPA